MLDSINQPLLDVRDLSVAFRQGGNESVAVDKVSFSIERGQWNAAPQRPGDDERSETRDGGLRPGATLEDASLDEEKIGALARHGNYHIVCAARAGRSRTTRLSRTSLTGLSAVR